MFEERVGFVAEQGNQLVEHGGRRYGVHCRPDSQVSPVLSVFLADTVLDERMAEERCILFTRPFGCTGMTGSSGADPDTQ